MDFEEYMEYPCGYKCHIKVHYGILSMYTVEWDTKNNICPIHGKDCKKV